MHCRALKNIKSEICYNTLLLLCGMKINENINAYSLEQMHYSYTLVSKTKLFRKLTFSSLMIKTEIISNTDVFLI